MNAAEAIALVVLDMAGTTVRDAGQVPQAFTSALAAHGVAVTPQAINSLRGASKRLAILNQDEIAALRHTAMGLSTAAQLGVERTPAIVFDKQAVLYGVTDLSEALNRYRAWISRRP